MDTIRAAIAVADLILIPARPSPHDLRAVGVIVGMAEDLKKPFGFVVTGRPRGRPLRWRPCRRSRSMAAWRR
jgi:cellulose biosynthesis protein BcsQ